MLRLGPFATLAVTLLFSSVSSQIRAQAPDAPRIPGAEEGSERWFAVFKERSFELDQLRERIRAARADRRELPKVDAEVERLTAAAATEHGDFAALCAKLGVVVRRRYWLIDAWLLELRPGVLPALRQHPAILQLQPDRYARPAIKTATDAKNHRVDSVQSAGLKGKGLGIAIVDSGQDEDHAGSKRPHATYYPGGNPANTTGGGIGGSRLMANYKIGAQPADDQFAHGTSIAATAAGAKWNQAATTDDGFAPEADIIGYAIADLSNAHASLATMVLAWQKVVADAAKHNILVGNMSYDGSAPALWAEQMAMDYAVLTADIVVTASAGNLGTISSHYAHGACNIFAVGATESNVHKVATFSSMGPNWYERARNYPHLVANGVSIVSPLIDNESSERTRNGTSYSAAMVAGSALLYRGVRTSANALETRAAILATLEDIGGKNRIAPRNDINAFGYGYLRTDHLIKLAQNKIGNRIVNAQLTTATPSIRYQFNVTQGKDYAAAISWNRLVINQVTWSNLDLAVYSGSTLLAKSDSPRNCNEHVQFRAMSTGTVDIVVSAPFLEAAQVPFALVACESLPPFVSSDATTLGQGCKSAKTQLVPQLVQNGSHEIGNSYDVIVSQADPQSAAAIVFGISGSQYGAFKLPLDLSPLGAQGCTLYTSLDVLWAHPTGVFGYAKQNIVVPNLRSLIFQKFYHQALVLSPGTNALNLTFTAGLELRVGGDLN